MKLKKESIQLSAFHPSLLLDLPAQSVVMTPVAINSQGVLIDGYRRYQLCGSDEIEAVEVDGKLFETAVSLNSRTRSWGETDCFLWSRWGRSLDIGSPELPIQSFPDELFDAEQLLLKALAIEKIAFRQFVLLCRTPSRHRKYLQHLLIDKIRLNGNETASFLEFSVDLISILGMKSVEEVFHEETLRPLLEDAVMSEREKGEKLLKQMRILRYPYYTKKLKEFSSSWGQLNIDPFVRVKKNLFLERGALEISFSANSYSELKSKVFELHASLDSPHWKKIWEG